MAPDKIEQHYRNRNHNDIISYKQLKGSGNICKGTTEKTLFGDFYNGDQQGHQYRKGKNGKKRPLDGGP